MDPGAPEPRPSPALRCAYCHDPADGATACPTCGTLTHPACREEAGGACPTLGCAHIATPAAAVTGEYLPRDPAAVINCLIALFAAAMVLGAALGYIARRY
ncbi:MAG: hypothetical protein M9894_02655 [Planctomycetes bacterium]|nr:hypothetical protein [Planctomycetota bacterium]